MRERLLAALNSSESKLVNSEKIELFVQSMQSQTRILSRTRNYIIMKSEARIAFAIGLTIYGDRIGKENSAFKSLHLVQLRSAARFFREACRLGLKENYRRMGDLYYGRHGAEICDRTAVGLYGKGSPQKTIQCQNTSWLVLVLWPWY